MYFAALLARTEDGWEASDTELDDVESLSDLADLARDASIDDDSVLVFIEQEDAWFGVVRVDGEEDPRIYVSDAANAARSSYGEILTNELIGREPGDDDVDLDALDLDGTEEGEPESSSSSDDEAPEGGDAVSSGPLGDLDLLGDFGVSARELRALEPGDALGEIADALGVAEVLEAVR
ncbi:hypothetical protein GT204_27875 [Streptomyces sp. SID4919]|uniref:tRNA adenosine deaminase-associated protein n=1 Tax=Streptomyces uncialis TaxID=1048205 RepID=A0A1Q4VB73_9ACTN|nr:MULTISPECIES: hypothetical protein [Streptomyces]MYY12612.1 hypothetical protein [Streptomyces sp. SID4919]MCX4664884.1 hypothetical protein [Streptomyces uncialis]OKH95101.1 hypothetical protein AB852_13435 [Streptomyces uncialis]WTE11846.1 hypothetical protein OG924_17220 [Streptomyces uncialis]SCK19707.1 putative tRNA adenosine deaminase-associated protein [Streptomyces sp. AmelKG-E11A]